MTEDSFSFHTKVLGFRRMIERFPQTETRRELDIQIDKLARMVEEFDKKFPWQLVLSVPAAKLRKKKGLHLHRLGQQAKHLDKLFWELLKESAVREVPGIEKEGKGKLNKVCQKIVEVMNSNLHKITEQMKLDTTSKAMEGLAGIRPPKQLKPRPKKKK
jgi:hypothetical protein